MVCSGRAFERALLIERFYAHLLHPDVKRQGRPALLLFSGQAGRYRFQRLVPYVHPEHQNQ